MKARLPAAVYELAMRLGVKTEDDRIERPPDTDGTARDPWQCRTALA